jgi:hypothetical protein
VGRIIEGVELGAADDVARAPSPPCRPLHAVAETATIRARRVVFIIS